MIENRVNLLSCFVGTLALIASMAVSGCSDAQSQARDREEAMQKFVTGAVQHMLDRNPETIQQSMTLLTRDEMTQPLVDKLVDQKLLPETDLSVLKIKDEAEEHHTSNQVVIDSAAPVDAATQPEIQFKVVGKEISEVAGKSTNTRSFEYLVTCKLTPEMDGFPRITALAPATKLTSTESADAEPNAHPVHKKHKHR